MKKRYNFWDEVSKKLDVKLLREEMKKNYQRSEMDAADNYGRLTPGSGNLSHEKGDVKGNGIRIENKFTEKKSFSINKDYLKEQIKQSRVLHGDELIVRIDYGQKEVYIVMREEFFKTLFNEKKMD